MFQIGPGQNGYYLESANIILSIGCLGYYVIFGLQTSLKVSDKSSVNFRKLWQMIMAKGLSIFDFYALKSENKIPFVSCCGRYTFPPKFTLWWTEFRELKVRISLANDHDEGS